MTDNRDRLIKLAQEHKIEYKGSVSFAAACFADSILERNHVIPKDSAEVIERKSGYSCKASGEHCEYVGCNRCDIEKIIIVRKFKGVE